VDEFGPLSLQPRPGRQWAAVSGKGREPGRAPRPRMRATYTRTAGCGTFSPPMRWRGQAVRAHQAAPDAGPVPGVLPVPSLAVPARDQDRDHLRQLQPAPEHRQGRPGRDLGRGEQRRNCLYPDRFVLVKPHPRSPPCGTSRSTAPTTPPTKNRPAYPPVHHLAQQPRLRRTTPPHHRPGKRCLMRH
jgi:hypothetical protein